MKLLRSRILWLAIGAAAAVWLLARRRPAHEPIEARAAQWPPLRMAEPPTQTEPERPHPDGVPHGTAPTRDVVPTEDEKMWVEPVDGACPASHPVKAKESSGIYHLPEGRVYQRTRADRCYLSPAHAESDGFRAAKN